MEPSKISKLFMELKKVKRSGLGIFITAGDPNFQISEKILNELPINGADFIELGMPFSDPMADGPSIQASSLRALKSGMNLKKTLLMVKNFRKKNNNTPIILMGYYNPIYSYGVNNFLQDSKDCGVDGFIVVDLPPEEDNELFYPAQKLGLDLIRLVTPTTNVERLKYILKEARGFIYYVSVTGITGTKQASIEKIQPAIKKICLQTDLPIGVGFGISTKKQVKAVSEIAQAVVVGSHIVKIIENACLNNKIIESEIVSDIMNEVKHLSSVLR